MGELIRRDRADQRRVKRGSGGGDARTSPNRFNRLMQVDIRHGYYADTAATGPCPDFVGVPTPPTLELMNSLGLLFLAEPTGFSVLYNVTRADDLLRYLRGHGTKPNGAKASQYWTRLSFALSLRNLSFINFTQIPIVTDPTQLNFYFTNQDAHYPQTKTTDQPNEVAFLTAKSWVSGEALLPVEGPEVEVITPEGVKAVVVFDIAGQSVLEVPRCVPVEGSPPTELCRDSIFLDFTALAEDKYVIETIGQPSSRQPMLYTIAKPVPLCFIDLLFSKPKPTRSKKGVYPVQDLGTVDQAAIAPVRYALCFRARSTTWRYYIVPQPDREELEGLFIESLKDSPSVSFSGPSEVRLANGALAYCFVSDTALELRQRSIYRFRLKGWARRAPGNDDILVARLPVAASTQVIPEDIDSVFSDIYVYV